MKIKRTRRPVLLAVGVLGLLVATFLWWVWRDVRRQRLDRALIAAVNHIDAKSVVVLLDSGANPDASDTPGQRFSLVRELKNLLERKPMPKYAGSPALILAIAGASSPYEDRAGYARAVLIVKALLDHGARVDSRDADGQDILYLAVNPDYDQQILRLLLQPHTKDIRLSLDRLNPLNDRTPLMSVAGWGGDETINLLCGAGSNVDVQDADGQTALMYAVDKGRPKNIACLLANHANVRLKNNSGHTALSMARSCFANKTVTPFNHETGADFWPAIVRMLEKASRKQSR